MTALIAGRTGEWEVVIGIEIHAQVVSEAKLFSAAATAFGAAPNTQVSFVDAAMPGMLPVINEVCIAQAVRTGLGLNARINRVSVFDRKNYFYADLPPGYQISQYKQPIVGEGSLAIDLPDGSQREIGIERLHLEQDAGKSLHDQDPLRTFVDLNRAGVALMEIVSKPDLRSAEEAAVYVRKLRSILRYLGTCDGNMEEGSMRADVNVSVRKPGAELGTRCEIKNVNSIRFIQQAIEYEARRQIELIEGGGTVAQATRLFDAKRGITREMRSKEEAHDYRYFPDPDLLPLELDPAWIEEMRKALPELPDAKKARFQNRYGLTSSTASVLVADKDTADAFERSSLRLFKLKFRPEITPALEVYLSSNSPPPDIIERVDPIVVDVQASASSNANVIIVQVFSVANETQEKASTLIDKIDTPGLIRLLENGDISGRQAKEVFEDMKTTFRPAAEIVAAKGLTQITDTKAIESAIAKVVADNPGQVAQYKGGKQGTLGWLVGQVMKATGGKANPKLVNELLRKELER